MWGNPTLFHLAKSLKKNIEIREILTQLRKAFSAKQNLSKSILREYKN